MLIISIATLIEDGRPVIYKQKKNWKERKKYLQ